MDMNVLIATGKRPPTAEASVELNADIRAYALNEGVTIGPIIWTNGPGCSNMAFTATGESNEVIEAVVKPLTLALMPSKWCETNSPMPTEDTYELQDMEN